MSERTTGIIPGSRFWTEKKVWQKPSVLRKREDAAHIECQVTITGKWWPLLSYQWDDYMEEVPYRLIKGENNG